MKLIDNVKLFVMEKLIQMKKNQDIKLMTNLKFWEFREWNKEVKFTFFEPNKFADKYFTKLKDLFLRKKRPPTVLAIVNHYYGKGKGFNGKSTIQDRDIRKVIVKKVINELRTIPAIDIKVCGIKNCSLIDIDVDFSYIEDPSFLVYESIEWMFSQVQKYDYFINMEDDVLLTRETFERIIEFDRKNLINECFHPNRMEYKNGREYCIDLEALPGWKNISKKFSGHNLKVAINPHSGISILSKAKMSYARKYIDLKKRDRIIGHYMASAYTNLHSPFLLFRAFSNLSDHKVIHLDNWDPK